ncbi:hypothetical protein C8R46DRAFT_1027564 [Mycena filopes]|nr:hypothetical protein C8R46DRAFT_1027564 [Mycena filopes]
MTAVLRNIETSDWCNLICGICDADPHIRRENEFAGFVNQFSQHCKELLSGRRLNECFSNNSPAPEEVYQNLSSVVSDSRVRRGIQKFGKSLAGIEGLVVWPSFFRTLQPDTVKNVGGHFVTRILVELMKVYGRTGSEYGGEEVVPGAIQFHLYHGGAAGLLRIVRDYDAPGALQTFLYNVVLLRRWDILVHSVKAIGERDRDRNEHKPGISPRMLKQVLEDAQALFSYVRAVHLS